MIFCVGFGPEKEEWFGSIEVCEDEVVLDEDVDDAEEEIGTLTSTAGFGVKNPAGHEPLL